jgi:hypothetical protein
MSGASSSAAAVPTESRSGDISYANLDLFFAKLVNPKPPMLLLTCLH